MTKRNIFGRALATLLIMVLTTVTTWATDLTDFLTVSSSGTATGYFAFSDHFYRVDWSGINTSETTSVQLYYSTTYGYLSAQRNGQNYGSTLYSDASALVSWNKPHITVLTPGQSSDGYTDFGKLATGADNSLKKVCTVTCLAANVTWNWSNDHTTCTATFTCAAQTSLTATVNATVTTSGSRHTASATFNGTSYSDTKIVWNGSGSGTSADPYLIKTTADLNQLATDVNGGTDYENMYFKQTADITLSGAWTPIGTYEHPFKGRYDGGGYTISGLTVTTSGQYAGLFGYVIGGTYQGSETTTHIGEVQGVVLQNPTVTVSVTSSEQYAGAVVGYAGNCARVYDNTVIGGTVTFTGGSNYNTNNSYAGGLIGYYENSNLTKLSGNKVSGTTVSGGGVCGGLVGYYRSNSQVFSGNFADADVSSVEFDLYQDIHTYGYRQGVLAGGYNINGGGVTSVNYYHSRNGLTAYGNKTEWHAISADPDNAWASPLYTVTGDGVTISSTPTVSLNGTDYYAAGATVTLTTDADHIISGTPTVTGAASSTVATDRHSMNVTIGTHDVTVSATLTAITGSCGTTATWTMSDANSDGTYETLTISGTGATYDYNATDNRAPWKTNFTPTSLVLASGITQMSIADEADLRLLSKAVNSGTSVNNMTFRQTANIAMSDNDFQPIGNTYALFNGTYDGGGYVISNLHASHQYHAGLFGRVSHATIKNVNLMNPTITGRMYLGAVVGWADASTQCIISNCHYYGSNDYKVVNYEQIGNTVTNCTRVRLVTVVGSGISVSPAATDPANGFQYDGNDYYGEGLSLTLSADAPAGFRATFSVNSTAISGSTYTVNNADATITATIAPDPTHFSQSGDMYTIHTVAGWNVFCELLANNTKGYFTGKTVKLGDDITVTRMAGSSQHDFTGTFDGDDHTLSVAYGSDDEPVSDDDKAAPFRNVENGCVIKDLHVTGDIYTSKKYASGLVGTQYGTVRIENCRVSTVIHSYTSGDGTHGGIVGNAGNSSNTKLTIEGCVFDGKLLTCGSTATTNCSGFVGYKGNNSTVTITNSLYAPAALGTGETEITDGSATFVRNGSAGDNCYYTCTLGTEQGKAKHTVTAGTDVTIDGIALSGTTTIYDVSGITAYADGGIERGGTLYYGSGDRVSLTLQNTPPTTLQTFSAYTASNGGALSGSANPYTLTMPDADVTIGATWTQLPVSYIDANGAQQTCTDYTVIYSGNMPTTLDTGWYVATGTISYTGTLAITNNVKLILTDECQMNLGTSGSRINANGIYNSLYNTLAIYGQSTGNRMGTLSIYTKDHNGIDTKALTINGGHIIVNADGWYSYAIYSIVEFTINGGTVEATAAGTNSNAIRTNTNFAYNGGNVTATTDGTGSHAIYATGGSYTFNWRTPDDRITIGTTGLYAPDGATATFSKAFIDEDGNIYSGTLTGADALATLAGKTLTAYNTPSAGYYLVGTMTNWGLNNNKKLTINTANTDEYMIQNVPLTTSDQFKVVYSTDGIAKTTWYPNGTGNNYGENGEITSDGIYDIYFRPDYQGGNGWFNGCIYVQRSKVDVTFAPEGFATYYHSMYDITLPAGVKARVITDSSDKLTYLTIADGDDSSNNIVPAGTAVMLQTAASTDPQQKTLTFAIHGESSPAAPTVNLLHGSDYQGLTTGGEKYYKMTYNTSGQNFGWYWGAAEGAAFIIPGHKAWLALPANAPAFLGLPDYETTEITPLLSPEGEDEGASPRGGLVGVSWYTLDGRKLNSKPTQKGLYINNGKKIIVK